MALDNIEKLVEKYFEGETSIAEENELKIYFSSTNVAQHLEQYQPIFGYFSQAKEQQFTQEIPLKARKRDVVMWLLIAASVVVLLGVGTFMYFETNKSEQFVACSPEDNPQLALEQTQKALALVSEHLNTGIESVNYINEYENSKNRIFKK
ncbi:hypothetical protein OX283_011425 [Flavobacterium sp. SUN052]|uniref:hypothetical protein n=1 Tax=Flavobacterium sp. SUN052 TaxID=3002441 RepID=UPI00237D8235|nr:hypothetical protein [Flavobacterium sp. SUN052]MEC4005270.1 hypothetical protein [Flavobacterium sp. SUN052]